MKTARWLPVLLAVATLACVPPRAQVDFETRLNRWVGRPVGAFMKANPLPVHSSPRPGGGQVFVFAKSDQTPLNFDYKVYTNYYTAQRVVQGAASPPPDWMNDSGSQWVSVENVSVASSSHKYCRVIVETDAKDIILAVRYEGNDCWQPEPLLGSPSSGMAAAQ